MIFNNTDDDNEKDDFFEKFEEEKPKAPKPPKYKPDDPRYWERPESEWEHLRPRHKVKTALWGIAVVAAAILIVCAYFWVFSPKVKDAVEFGYVDHVELRGDIFNTYEGNLLPYKSIHDTTRSYQSDFVFSASKKVGAVLRSFQNSGRPVRVTYKVFRSTMPWRGDSHTVVVRVDTVSPDSILPAAYLPWLH